LLTNHKVRRSWDSPHPSLCIFAELDLNQCSIEDEIIVCFIHLSFTEADLYYENFWTGFCTKNNNNAAGKILIDVENVCTNEDCHSLALTINVFSAFRVSHFIWKDSENNWTISYVARKKGSL